MVSKNNYIRLRACRTQTIFKDSLPLTPEPRYARLREVPLSQISPGSWMRNYLFTQKQGLTGHINAAGYPFNSIGWKGIVQLPPGYQPFKIWWPYEQTAYWIDGSLRCGYLLKDSALIDSAKSYLESVLSHPQANGVLGPRHLSGNYWPHAILWRAMMAYYAATGDSRIPRALTEHFMATKDGYTQDRNVENIETMCWLYGVTGNKKMLDLAVRSYDVYNMTSDSDETLAVLLSDKEPGDHGVSFLELVKIPAILYMYTGSEKYLNAAIHGFEKLEKYHMLIDGAPSSSEGLNGNASDNVHETCDISDYIWSAGYMLMATGDPKWGDRLERACFNAGVGCVTKDFKAHQYFAGPNQVIADQHSSRWMGGGPFSARMAYQPFHDTECCTGNVNRIMPDFLSRMWLRTDSGGIVAAMFGPTRIDIPASGGKGAFSITEETNYPFSGEVQFLFKCKAKQAISVPLSIRIPDWSEGTTITVDGTPVKETIIKGQFFRIPRALKNGSRVRVNFSMRPRLLPWPGDGVGITVGPMVYSLNIPPVCTVNKQLPSYLPGFYPFNMRPNEEWSYALDIKDTAMITVSKDRVLTGNPWDPDHTPVHITVPAWKISGWELKNGSTPGLPTSYQLLKKDTIKLQPLGTTRLRVSIFPDIRKKYSQTSN